MCLLSVCNTSFSKFCNIVNAIILAMQSKMSADNAELLEEIRKLNSKFDIMQSDFVVTKKVNSELSSRLANMGHQCLAIAHYPR